MLSFGPKSGDSQRIHLKRIFYPTLDRFYIDNPCQFVYLKSAFPSVLICYPGLVLLNRTIIANEHLYTTVTLIFKLKNRYYHGSLFTNYLIFCIKQTLRFTITFLSFLRSSTPFLMSNAIFFEIQDENKLHLKINFSDFFTST